MIPQTTDEIIEQLQASLKAKNLNYRTILKLSAQLSKLDPKFQRFSIDAKTLIHLGRDSIKDHTTALIELVKNGYDADAHNVEVGVFCKNGSDLIRVADNGFGMTRDQILNSWLRIGFSNKRESKLSQQGRRKTGEKGIGRISTDRLGAILELTTKTEEDGIIGLKVNWNDFDVEGKDVFDIDIELTNPTSITIPKKEGKECGTGTEIKVTKLRQSWSTRNIENLYYELSALTPPFNEVVDFEISLENDVTGVFSGKVSSDFLKTSEIELTAIYDGKGSDIIYNIKDKYSDQETTEFIKWQNLLDKLPKREINSDITDDLSLGPVTIKLLFFLRQAASIAGTKLKLDDLRSFLDNNAGIKIYRDNFAVKPYGFPNSQFGYDWLELGDRKIRNPAGIGRADEYMVNPNQLVGAVFISRDKNPKLVDSAAREGLVESEEFSELKALVKGSILMLESHRVKIYPQIQKDRKEKQSTSAHQDAEKIKAQLSLVRDDLTTIKDEIEKKGAGAKSVAFLKPIAKTISIVENISEEVDSTITDLLNWQRVLSGLATMGISSAVFGHETESSISQFKGSVNAAKLVLTEEPPNITSALEELDKALKHSKKVAAWGAYALTRVQREKRIRRNTQVIKTISTVVKELQPAFDASSIRIKIEGENFYTRTYPMDIESILVNLLTNSYTATLIKSGERIVLINVEKEDRDEKRGFYFSVADTGPGIAKEFEHRVFEPLFSTKTVGANNSKSIGTGLGLTIVKSITEELNGEVTFDKDPVLGGARFKIWLPKED
jgi:signal transduction histidine kinase